MTLKLGPHRRRGLLVRIQKLDRAEAGGGRRAEALENGRSANNKPRLAARRACLTSFSRPADVGQWGTGTTFMAWDIAHYLAHYDMGHFVVYRFATRLVRLTSDTVRKQTRNKPARVEETAKEAAP